VPSLRIGGQLPATIVNGWEASFENSQIFNFEGFVTVTLDRVILHTVVHHSLTSTYMQNFIEIEGTLCERTVICMYIRTDAAEICKCKTKTSAKS